MFLSLVYKISSAFLSKRVFALISHVCDNRETSIDESVKGVPRNAVISNTLGAIGPEGRIIILKVGHLNLMAAIKSFRSTAILIVESLMAS